MNEIITTYTSTGDKLQHHPEAIKDLIEGHNHPIALHIMPTEVCNLRCGFCSVAQRGEEGKLFPSLTMDQIKHVVGALLPMGLKAVILSGGGEPTIYPKINVLLRYLAQHNLDVGLITNGVTLDRIQSGHFRGAIKWVRISINTLDYTPNLVIPVMPRTVTLGLSYIWTKETTKKSIENIQRMIQRQEDTPNPVRYVRVLPDCNLESAELEKFHKWLAKEVKELGPPFFHQWKSHRQPPQCHLGRVHPVLYTDGYIYPCDSLVLNSPADDKRFHPEYALCRWDEVKEFYKKPIKGSLIDTQMCPHCVWYRQNDILSGILLGRVPEDWSLANPPAMEHINFI